VDVLGHAQVDPGMPTMPTSAVKDQHDLLGGASADLAGELSQLDLEACDADAGRQMEQGAPGGGVDEADEIAPGEAVLDDGDGAPRPCASAA